MFGSPSSYTVFRTGYPVNVYLIIVIPIVLLITALLDQINFNDVMMNLPIGILLFYVFFLRHSSKVEITNLYEMRIIYFFPWNEDRDIDLEDFKSFQYEKERWRFYDVIRLTDRETDEVTEIKLNMRAFALPGLLNFMQNEVKLQIPEPAPVKQIV